MPTGGGFTSPHHNNPFVVLLNLNSSAKAIDPNAPSASCHPNCCPSILWAIFSACAGRKPDWASDEHCRWRHLTLQDAQHQQHQIRLAGIDAPELAQAFGQHAKTSLSLLALNQQATANCQKPNPNRLEICAVTIGGKDIGLAQIGSGMAWWYQQNAEALSVQTQTDYRQAEFNAKIHRLGFWNSKNPTPPWVWRHGRVDD